MVLSSIDRSFALFVAKRISKPNPMENKLDRSWRGVLATIYIIFALGEKCGYLFGHAWIKGEDVKDDLL